MILQHTTRKAMRHPLRIAARHFSSKSAPEMHPSASKNTPETPPSASKGASEKPPSASKGFPDKTDAPKKPDVDAGSKAAGGAPKAAAAATAKSEGPGPAFYLAVAAVGGAGAYYSQYGLELPEALGGSLPAPVPAKKIVKPVPLATTEKVPKKTDVTQQSTSAASDAAFPASSASTTSGPASLASAESASSTVATTSETDADLVQERTDAESAVMIEERPRALLSDTDVDSGDAPAVPAADTAAAKEDLKLQHEDGKAVMTEFVGRENKKEYLQAEHTAGREIMETRLAEGPEVLSKQKATQEKKTIARTELLSILNEDLSDSDRLVKLEAALASVFNILPADDPVYEEASALHTHILVNQARDKIKADLRIAFLERNAAECARLVGRAKSYGIDYFYEMYLAEYFTAPGRLLEILHDNSTGPYADSQNFKITDFIKEETKMLDSLEDVKQLRERCLEHATKLADVQVHYRADAQKKLAAYVEAVEEQTGMYVQKAMKVREVEVATQIAKAQEEFREKLREEFNEELRTALEEQEQHLQQRFANDLVKEQLAYELALERDREDFLLEQNELKAEVASYTDVLKENSAQFELFRTHRKLVNALLAIEKQIKNGQETNFDLVDDAFIREACELTGQPRGEVFQEPKDFIDSFNRSLRSWVVSAFTTDDSITNCVLAQLFGRLYCVDRRGFTPSTLDNDVEKGISGLQIAAAHIESNDLTQALHSMETLEGTPALLEHVKPWITRARTSLVLQQQLDLLRAQVACLHVTHA